MIAAGSQGTRVELYFVPQSVAEDDTCTDDDWRRTANAEAPAPPTSAEPCI